MEIFAYKKSRYARARIRELGRLGGIRSQQVQAMARLAQPIGPRRLPAGEWLRFELRGDRYGNFVRIDVYKSLRRENQRDVVIDIGKGVHLVEGISEGEIRDRRWRDTKHCPEIVED